MTTAIDTTIAILCYQCPRRQNVCCEYPPTYLEAYRCKYDEAVGLLDKLDVLPKLASIEVKDARRK